MKTTATTCDRCRRTIEAEGSALDPTCGPLRGRLDARPVDLCRDCGEAFATWLRGAEAPAPDKTDTPTRGGTSNGC
jgi:hypothetical protein